LNILICWFNSRDEDYDDDSGGGGDDDDDDDDHDDRGNERMTVSSP